MNKEDFIKRFHTIKIFKFEPPTWEEFLETRDENSFAHWFCGDIAIVMSEENGEKGIMHCANQFEISIFEDYDNLGKNFRYINEFGIDTREQQYYKALEYAQKIFLGLGKGE